MLFRLFFVACVLILWPAGPALAHFGMIIPSSSMILEQGDAAIGLELSFSHPMAGQGMPLARPKSVGVVSEGKRENLGAALREIQIMDQAAWELPYTVKRPGVYQFIMEPQPYWEPAEDCFIIHYAKTYVAAFGEEAGWDEPAGLKTEIVPLTRPFGNYAGNVFQGRVLFDGKPVPGAEVEVEFYNRERRYAPPNDYFITQVIKADADGVFTYGVPFAGWWGFAALSTSAETLQHEGRPKSVELGAVLWVEFADPVRR